MARPQLTVMLVKIATKKLEHHLTQQLKDRSHAQLSWIGIFHIDAPAYMCCWALWVVSCLA